jgi:hypothetical protein
MNKTKEKIMAQANGKTLKKAGEAMLQTKEGRLFFLQSEIENTLLEFAYSQNDMTNSDFQGVAMVKARELIKMITEFNEKENY